MLTLWTADPELARNADKAGIDRVGLDLESIGKDKRQPIELGTWISPHCIKHVCAVAAALKHAALFARTNPLHANLEAEVEQLLDLGVRVLMFPNFQDVGDLEQFLRLVRGRAKVIPLVERLKAVRQIEQIIAMKEIDEIHIGMNDLTIDLGLPTRMSLLVSETLACIASVVSHAGKRLGVGGLGRAFDTNLPIPSDLIYAQYPRLGATSALIARVFAPELLSAAELSHEIGGLRERMHYWFTICPEELDASRRTLKSHLAEWH